MDSASEAGYIHGTHAEEQERLRLLNHLTNRPFLQFLDVRPGDRVLEVGAGLGILANAVATTYPRSAVTGVEVAEAQLARAREHFAATPNLTLLRGDAHALEFADGSFDVVYCRYLLEHVAGPETVLAEMRRVLRPGGRAFVQENNILVNVFDPACPAFDAVWRRFVELQARLGGDATIGRRLLRLLRGAGFGSVEVSVAPEVHGAGSPGFDGWVVNLAGNVRGAADKLVASGLVPAALLDEALRELDGLRANPDGAAYFYWNRAAATR